MAETGRARERGPATRGASRERGRPGEGRGAQLNFELFLPARRIVAKEIAKRAAGDGSDIGIAGRFNVFDEFGQI